MNKINGRTPEEIKKGLELCIGNSDLSEDYCEKCPYIPDASCRDTLEIDALALIQQLEAERDEYKRERDAAVEQLRGHCWVCIHFERGKLLLEKEVCMNCMHNFDDETLEDHWQWRGAEVE